MLPTTCCPHCTNEDQTLLEALDQAGVIWLCHVCSKTFVNPALPNAPALNKRADDSAA